MSTPVLPPPPQTESPEPESQPMGFWDHVNELRWTIIKSALVFTVFVALIGYKLRDFHQLLLKPFNEVAANYPHLSVHLGTTTMMEGFNGVFQVCMVGGLMLAAPFILFFVAQFIAPALTARETKILLPLCVAACVLFILGAAFGFFFLLPAAIDGLIRLNDFLGLESRPSVGSYYSLLIRCIVGVGGAFEFPLVIVMLSWLGLVTSRFLRTHRRHAIVAIFTLAAIITPSWDPFFQCLTAAPLYLLYELGIFVAARVEARRHRSAAAVLLALAALWPRGRREVNSAA